MSSESGLRALGGGPLCGDEWVRILYLDESGIGSIDKDPLLIVAGVLVHGDKNWRAIADDLLEIRETCAPDGEPTPTYLHAKDIYHGTGEFHRERWPREHRLSILDRIAALPGRHRIPLVWGSCSRVDFAAENPTASPQEQLTSCYSMASIIAFLQAEWFMRNRAGLSEIASIVMERNANLQRQIHDLFRTMKEPADYAAHLGWDVSEIIPIKRLIDAPSFQDKAGSSILQLADFCAFALKRAADKRADAVRLAKPLAQVAMTWDPPNKPLIRCPI